MKMMMMMTAAKWSINKVIKGQKGRGWEKSRQTFLSKPQPKKWK